MSIGYVRSVVDAKDRPNVRVTWKPGRSEVTVSVHSNQWYNLAMPADFVLP